MNAKSEYPRMDVPGRSVNYEVGDDLLTVTASFPDEMNDAYNGGSGRPQTDQDSLQEIQQSEAERDATTSETAAGDRELRMNMSPAGAENRKSESSQADAKLASDPDEKSRDGAAGGFGVRPSSAPVIDTRRRQLDEAEYAENAWEPKGEKTESRRSCEEELEEEELER